MDNIFLIGKILVANENTDGSVHVTTNFNGYTS